jgi:hypothetical protein
MSFTQYLNYGNIFNASGDVSFKKELDKGVYNISISREGTVYFEKIDFNCDNIVDLDTVEYSQITSEMSKFLTPSVKQKFIKNGFNSK